MRPALVMPFNDPAGSMFPHLQAIVPDLKAHFERAYLSAPAETVQRQPQNIQQLQQDDFFTLYPLESASPIGLHFAALYRQAAQDAHPEQILHLCYPDRLTFALRTGFREQFLADVTALHPEQLPLIFQRSPAAWDTHPKNYRQIEGFVTRIGEELFGKSLDYGWCHFVIQAAELRAVMTKVTHPGLSMVGEMVLYTQHHIHTREVDWLAWEDPFLLERDPLEYKRERENSLEETEKRLSYCLPQVELLVQFSKNGK